MSGLPIFSPQSRLLLGSAERDAAGRRPVAAAALAVAAVVVAAMLVASQARRADNTTVSTSSDGSSVSVPPSRAPSDAGSFISLDGGTPSAFPDSRLGLAFISLDGQMEGAIAVLGEPTSRQPDITGAVATWPLPGGARFAVSTWTGTSRIAALQAAVPPGSPVAVAAFGGVVIGRSSLRNVVSAWGTGYATATSGLDDYAVRYIECVGSLAVVVKFDQAARARTGLPATGVVLWDQPVTRVLIAYADEPPGSAGCRG